MEKANENRNLYHGRKKGISKLRPPQLTTNKFGFVKESCVAEKAEFEQLEKQSKVFCKENVPKTEFKQCDLKLGDPVCISGVKKGILRYYGETKFADGIWCGIELDEPVGKNNGIIEGVQYFQCKENHGIFAPVSKVQLISNAEPPHNAQQPVSSNFRVDNFQQVHKFSYKNLTDFRRTSSPKESLSHLTFCADQESRIPFPNYVGTKKDSHSEQCLSFVLRRNSGFGKDNKNLSVKELKDCENLCSDTFVRNEKEESAKIMPSSLLIDKTTHSTESLTVAFPETNAKADVLDKDDLNSTFTLDKPAEISETTIVKDQDALNTTFDVDLSPINDNFNKLSDPCLKLISDLNSTFTLETTTEFEKGKEEPKENECNFLKSEKKLSFEDAFDINDIDDDQPSLDESLGILTPNQMKDFSIDQQGVIVFDGDMFRIPKMASCDNIDDIPEDEVKETLSHLNDPYVQILAENRENDFESADLLYESRTLPKSTKNTIDNNDEFDEVSKNSRQTSTPYGNTRTLKSEFPSSPLIGSSEFNMGVDSYDKNLKLVMKDQTKTDTTLGDIVTDNKNIERKINEIDQEEIPSCSFIHNITFSNQIDGDDVNFDSELKSLNDDKEKVSAISNENLQISIENLNMQHISDNNCNNAPLTIDSEISENNFLTNNIPICSDTNVLMKSDIEVIKVERPASTYTTGSTDTGYQEDGDFDVQSEISAAVPSPCSEIPTHSIYNSNRNMGLEDNERHQIEMSDSDFFTDSGGVGFTTESEMETDGECKMVSDFTVESNGMDTVVERNNQNEDQRNVILTTKQDDTLKEIISENVSEDLAKDVTVSQTVTSSLNSVCDSTTTTIYTTTTTTNNNNNDKNITVVNETIDLSERKFSGVEKTNSFIISGKEENSLKENSDTQKHLLKNKTWIKTKEPNKTKKDNILKARTQNENLQTSEKRPKKNVVSKIKLMIETSVSKTPKNNENSQKTNRLKKNRWDDVTSKIAASLAEEKSKVKTKREIKSRIDTNLSVAKQIPSRRSSQLDSTRTSFSIENENTSITDSVNTKRIKNVQKILSPTENINTDLQDRENVQSLNKNENHTLKQKKRSAVSSSHSISSLPKSESSTISIISHNSHISRPSSGNISQNFQTFQNISGNKSNLSKQNKQLVEKKPNKMSSQTMKRTLKKEGTQGKPLISQKRPIFPNLDMRRPPLWASKTELSKEIQRLGALCEARTKELNLVKMQLRHAAAGFEAFSVLIKYMIEDLNAFSGPKVVLEMKKTKQDLNKNLLQLKNYQDQIEDLKVNHAQEISNLTEKVSRMHNDELCDLKMKHNCELEEAKCHHEKKVLEMKELYEKTIYKNEEQYLKIMEELKDEYVKQKQELEQMHNKQLSNSIAQHEKTQSQLISQLNNLQQQYEELQEQAKEIEETLKKSSDAKMQWLVSKKNDLEKEVESLKTVMEMKQTEIRSLRKENLEMKKELEELPIARDKIQKLRARKEELEALIEERSRAQSVLSTEHEQLKEHFEKESDINKKLAMEKEELQWKLQQSMETSSFLASLSESSPVVENNSLPPRLSSSFHAYYSNASEKLNSHHSLSSSSYKSYRRSSSLSETTLPSCKKLKQIWDNSPLSSENVRKMGMRSHSFLKAHSSQTSKHPKHRSFTLHSGRSFADHIKSLDNNEERKFSKEIFKGENSEKKQDFDEINNKKDGAISQSLPCDISDENGSHFGKSLKWRFKLPKTEETLPIKKLFENSIKNNHKKPEYDENRSLEQTEKNEKEPAQDFVVVLEASGSVAAYKTNLEQDDTVEESSKFSDSIEGSFISPQDGFDNSINLSCSLQSSVISDDSAWSSTSFPPQPHTDRGNQDFSISPSSDDSFSSESPKQDQIESLGINVEQEESSSSGEQSQCVRENCKFRSVSPKSLAGEAMVQDDSPISISQMSEEFSISMSCKKHKRIEKLEITEESASKDSWEVSCCINKEKVLSSNNAETPSMETTSQGLLMSNSNIDDISWDSEDMPSESEI